MNTTEKYLEEILRGWEQSVLTSLPKIFLAIGVLVLFVILARLAKRISLKFYSETIKVHLDVANIIASIIYFFFILSGTFLALQIVGLEQVLTNVLAGAGIIGIIAGFALKDIASNIFSGLLLKIQHPFKKDDWVEIDGKYGEILEVGWITTTIKTIPGQEVFVPNQVIYSNTFINFSTFQKRRVILKGRISYSNDLEKVKAAALDEVKKMEELLTGGEVDFYFTEIGNSTFHFQLRFWIKFETNDDFRKAKSNIIMRIKKRFEQENIKGKPL
jgi:small conductance mechanosensitive channel